VPLRVKGVYSLIYSGTKEEFSPTAIPMINLATNRRYRLEIKLMARPIIPTISVKMSDYFLLRNVSKGPEPTAPNAAPIGSKASEENRSKSVTYR